MDKRPPIKSLIEMQDELIRSKNPFVRHIGSLLAAGALDKHLSELRDEQIGQLIGDVVERDLKIASSESVICNQASRRLLRSGAGRLHSQDHSSIVCPNCGNNMLYHVGIDEPDFYQCVHLGCEFKKLVKHPEEHE